ncbi:MAG: YicC family protein [Treponema sp.]|nr:MAG: YicC family protein [Treponema sp.]
MKSMTGYARIEKQAEDYSLLFEIKSYNSRYLDIYINLPFWLGGLESFIRTYFSSSSAIFRGKVEINIRIQNLKSDFTVHANTHIARMYANALRNLSRDLNLTEPTLAQIINYEGVLETEIPFDEEKWKGILIPVFEEAFTKYDNSKKTEGAAIKTDIQKMISKIDDVLEHIKNESPKMEAMFRNNIKAKFKELFDNNYDENRVYQETAALLVRHTINEEIVRLDSHLSSLKNEIEKVGAIGKRVDFICQEINREINTIGSKNQMLEIAQDIIYAKDAIENIREQIRNVE